MKSPKLDSFPWILIRQDKVGTRLISPTFNKMPPRSINFGRQMTSFPFLHYCDMESRSVSQTCITMLSSAVSIIHTKFEPSEFVLNPWLHANVFVGVSKIAVITFDSISLTQKYTQDVQLELRHHHTKFHIIQFESVRKMKPILANSADRLISSQGHWKQYEMVEVNSAYGCDRYERKWLKYLRIISNIFFATQDKWMSR